MADPRADNENNPRPSDLTRSFAPDETPEGRRPDDGEPRGRGAHAGGPGAESVMPGREQGAGGGVDDGPRNTPGDPAAQARSARADDKGAPPAD
jgi:hypothetical protein